VEWQRWGELESRCCEILCCRYAVCTLRKRERICSQLTLCALQRPSLVPYGTPHSAVTSTVSSPAAGPFSSDSGYLGCEGGGPSSAGRVKSEGVANGSGGVGEGRWLGEGHSNGQHAMR
jgi:hypothetical protein